MKTLINKLFLLALILSLTSTIKVSAHCEIPCGIYEDELRVSLLKEHITTIEKSMNQINTLSEEESINYNQLVRWVNNKELHANKLQEIVSQYFLHQRIKITDKKDDAAFKKYEAQLVALHELLVYAMKAKQTTDLAYIEKLRKGVETFEGLYFHKHE